MCYNKVKITSRGEVLCQSLIIWINAAVSVNLVPSKGITLPFISYGGTSLIIYMILAAVLLNISKSANSEVK